MEVSGAAAALGKFGVWSRAGALDPDRAVEWEALGYRAIWVGGSPPGDLRSAEDLLDATRSVIVATGIVNVWNDEAGTVGRAYHRLAARHPGRFLLGVGVGHPEAIAGYQRPYETLVTYLDRLDEAGVPVADRALAALGPRVLRLAGQRTAGAHPYLTTPAHTSWARGILGEGPLLAPEQKVVVDTDPERARAIGRRALGPYLRLANYRSNLRRLGYGDEDLTGDGSDRLVDALVPHGDAATVVRAAADHLSAGADHVCIQVLDDDPRAGYRALAAALPVDGPRA